MSYVAIDSWTGRFSNNLIQLSNACAVALAYGFEEVYFPTHESFSGRVILLKREQRHCLFRPPLIGTFFSFADVRRYLPIRPKYWEARDITRTYISPIIKGWDVSFSDEFEADVLIHLRGGDVFGRAPHRRYVPAPLAYFESVIEEYGSATIVTEDHRHPALKKLSKRLDVNIAPRRSFLQDLAIIGSARNICVGPGTFWYAGFLLGECVQNVHLTVPFFPDGKAHDVWKWDGWPHGVSLHKSYLYNYIKAGEWGNSWLQRRKIINYDFTANAQIARSADKDFK